MARNARGAVLSALAISIALAASCGGTSPGAAAPTTPAALTAADAVTPASGAVAPEGTSAVDTSALKDGLYAQMDTSKGTILLELFYDRTPLTVANFVGLAEGTMDCAVRKGQPFYDGLSFHRVIADFMIQGGDPAGNGTGGPGYKFADEFLPELAFTGPGDLAMANSGPGTNGSQFFITHVKTDWLTGKHTIFGKVVTGQDVVNKIAVGDKIVKLSIIRKGAAATAFKSGQAAFDAIAAAAKAKGEAALAESRKKGEAAALAMLKGKVERTPSGLAYVVSTPGAGAKPAAGATVSVHYRLTLPGGKVVDASFKGDKPAASDEAMSFPVGIGQVIPGFDEAVLAMKAGERRVVAIPPDLGYGAAGAGGGVIPPNSWLVFDIILVSAG